MSFKIIVSMVVAPGMAGMEDGTCCTIVGKNSLTMKMNKPKYIFFSGRLDYWKIANEDLFHNKEVFVCDGINIPFSDRINGDPVVWRWDGIRRLPLKRLWYNFYTCAPYFDKEKVQYAIFTENNVLSFSRGFLSRLRGDYPNLVMVFEFTNVCGKYNNFKKLLRVMDLYDHIVTFNEADSRQYGFRFRRLCYSFREPEESDVPYTDLFFIGKEKGRLPDLLSIYDHVTQLGLKCSFYITNVAADKQAARKGIIYNRWIPYRKVLQHVSHTRCILEILEDQSNYFSLRTYEALVYKKKLITAAPDVLKADFYSSSQMLYIQKAKDITREFFEVPFTNGYDVAALSPNAKLQEYAKLSRTKP